MDRRRRARVRTRLKELAALRSASAPEDEYDCLVGSLFSRLSQGPSPGELADWLRAQVTDHFGLCDENAEEFARRVTDWYRATSLR